VVTPQSPLGKVLMGHGQGENVEYQMGNERVRARVQKVF
jgi:transcription elongation GreA/GreB family factor